MARRSAHAASVILRPNQYAGIAPSGAAKKPINASRGLMSHATTANPATRDAASTIWPRASVTVRTPFRS